VAGDKATGQDQENSATGEEFREAVEHGRRSLQSQRCGLLALMQLARRSGRKA